MEIVDTYQLLFQSSQQSILNSEPQSQVLADDDPLFDDPDSAYDYWVKTDVFEPNDKFTREDLIKHIFAANKVQLDLKAGAGSSFSSNIMKQHSIQVSLFEAMILVEVLNNNYENWELKMQQAQSFLLSSASNNYQFETNQNKVNVVKQQQTVGSLTIDFEQQVIEKIYGNINDKRFVIDPIWKHSQTTIDAVKLVLGDFFTEIVHHPKHKKTLWRGKNNQIMAITKNKTYQINQNLFLNKKQMEWPHTIIQSLQWFAPWQHFAIAGHWFIDKLK